MHRPYVQWGAWRVTHQGEATESGRFVAFGRLCTAARCDDSDPKVEIFHEQGKGYTYRLLP